MPCIRHRRYSVSGVILIPIIKLEIIGQKRIKVVDICIIMCYNISVV